MKIDYVPDVIYIELPIPHKETVILRRDGINYYSFTHKLGKVNSIDFHNPQHIAWVQCFQQAVIADGGFVEKIEFDSEQEEFGTRFDTTVSGHVYFDETKFGDNS